MLRVDAEHMMDVMAFDPFFEQLMDRHEQGEDMSGHMVCMARSRGMYIPSQEIREYLDGSS